MQCKYQIEASYHVGLFDLMQFMAVKSWLADPTGKLMLM